MAKDYKFYQYDYKERWISYWHQIDEILKLEPESVLEIGVADKVVADYLKKQGVAVKTLDINRELKPDFTANVLKMPLLDNSFFVILCAEVLEHLPFNNFEKALLEIKRVSKKFVVLTLPHFGPAIKICLKLPFVKEKRFAFKLPFLKKHQSKALPHNNLSTAISRFCLRLCKNFSTYTLYMLQNFCFASPKIWKFRHENYYAGGLKEHCWEIGKKGYSAEKIKKIIRKHFKIRKEFIPFENQYHHFFILEK